MALLMLAGAGGSSGGGASVSAGSNQERVQTAIASAIGQSFALPSVVSGLQYPTDPTTTETLTVTTDAEFNTAVNAGNGKLIRVYGPGNGGQASYDGFPQPPFGGWSDIDIVMDNDTTVSTANGFSWFGPIDRFRWTGGGITWSGGGYGPGFRLADARDVMFDNVNMTRSGTGINEGHVFYPGSTELTRCAFINSTFDQGPVTTTNNYSVFSSAATASDQIYVNNLHVGCGPPIRFIKLEDRLVMVGNYYTYTAASAVRLHEAMNGVWFGYNYVVRTVGSAELLKFVVDGEASIVRSDLMQNFLIEHNKYFNLGTGHVIHLLGDNAVPANQDNCPGWTIQYERDMDPGGSVGGSAMSQSGISITNPYTWTDNLVIGPGHADYITDPGQSSFGADH